VVIVLLAELVGNLDFLSIRNDTNVEITGIAYDSRKVRKGFMFVCIDGTVTDGHLYASQAIENGAMALITEKDLPDVDGVPIIKVRNARHALACVSDKFYGHPSGKVRLVGITGTKGKTTTAFMLKSILEAAGRKVGMIGTLGTIIGNRMIYSERTTPESLDLQSILSMMVSEGVEDVVMEVSSQGLALERVSFCDFDIGVFTNLSRDHIGEREHKSMEDYFMAKCRLFKMCKKGIINIDNIYGRKVLEEAECRVLTIGIDEKADIMAKNIVKLPQSVEFDLESGWYGGRIKVGIPGKFSVYNSLAAVGVCGLLGVPMNAVLKGLSEVRVPGRAELVDTGSDFSVIIDYAHTPDSLMNILSAVREYTSGRVISLFGCGGDRDMKKRPMMGEISGRLADYTIITSDNPRTEKPDDIIKQIEEGIRKTNGKYICISDRKQAIRHALSIAQKGDTIVLAGKGHETYQTFKDKTIHFDEREIVRELLQEINKGAG